MNLVFTSYVSSPEYHLPEAWLNRIRAFTGILESLAFNNKVISIERINFEGKYERNGVQYYFMRLNKKVIRFPWGMHRSIKGLRPDVVFINGFIFPLQIIQLRLKLGKQVKIIVINRAEKPSSSLRKFLQCQADKCVNAYLFASREMGADWVVKGIIAREKKIAEIMHASSFFTAIDRNIALKKTGITGKYIFLWVGRLDANKDPLLVIKAFGQYVKSQPTARLYIIYHTSELKYEIDQFCERENLQNIIQMIGAVTHEEMIYWYNSADFIVSGSHYEGGGVAVCEAMSCGCIPIVTNIQSFRKITGPGKCGILYEPGNDKELLTSLVKTKDMDIQAERAKALEQFKEELSFEAIAKKINQLLASL
ncbi:MAG: glycosyltransferase family 4 protein [Chitinophagaceae bacterium]|nr:glycosyltransferase family 4 protein [Chitinophagaceae bacterium]